MCQALWKYTNFLKFGINIYQFGKTGAYLGSTNHKKNTRHDGEEAI